MTFSFHPEADAEFQEAVQYYEGCEPGLGWDFALEIHATIEAEGVLVFAVMHLHRSPDSWKSRI